jgi:hypothetical protein
MLASFQSFIQSIEESKMREEKKNKEPSSKKYPFLVYALKNSEVLHKATF